LSSREEEPVAMSHEPIGTGFFCWLLPIGYWLFFCAAALTLAGCARKDALAPGPAPGEQVSGPLSRVEIEHLIGTLQDADSFLESDFERRAGRIAAKLARAGQPAWDAVAAAIGAQEDEDLRGRLNAVLACIRWKFSPYFIFALDTRYLEALYTRQAPPRGEWFDSIESFRKAGDASRLIYSFGLNDPAASYYIFEALHELGPQAIEPLLEAVSDERPYFHFCVTVALMRVAPRSLDRLIELARDKNPDIRARAVWALGLSGARESVPPLLAALADKAASIRSSAAYMFGVVLDSRSVAPLMKALKDSSAEVAAFAADSLGIIGDPLAIGALRQYVRSGREDALRRGTSALAGIGGKGADSLLSLLKDPDEEIRTAAAIALGELRSPATVAPLTGALADKSAEVRTAAADSLSYFGGRKAVPALRKLLADKDPEVRAVALHALGRLGGASALKALSSMLEDESGRVRLGAVVAIGKLDSKEALRVLVGLLCDPELAPLAADGIEKYGSAAAGVLVKTFGKSTAEGKCAIARLLAEAGAKEAVPTLIGALSDPDINVRFCADKALKIITGHETSYKCDAPGTERTKGMEEWRRWWKEYGEAGQGR